MEEEAARMEEEAAREAGGHQGSWGEGARRCGEEPRRCGEGHRRCGEEPRRCREGAACRRCTVCRLVRTMGAIVRLQEHLHTARGHRAHGI